MHNVEKSLNQESIAGSPESVLMKSPEENTISEQYFFPDLLALLCSDAPTDSPLPPAPARSPRTGL